MVSNRGFRFPSILEERVTTGSPAWRTYQLPVATNSGDYSNSPPRHAKGPPRYPRIIETPEDLSSHAFHGLLHASLLGPIIAISEYRNSTTLGYNSGEIICVLVYHVSMYTTPDARKAIRVWVRNWRKKSSYRPRAIATYTYQCTYPVIKPLK